MARASRHAVPLLLTLLLGCSLRLPFPWSDWDAGDAEADVDVEVDGDADRDGDAADDGGADGDGDADTSPDSDVESDVEADSDVATDADLDVEVDGREDGDVLLDADEDDGCVGGGHDEDGDGVDDDCDLCPTIPDPSQADGDGDGLGDACEQPGREGRLSSIAFFDPFVSYTDAGYTDASGAYSRSSDLDGVYATTTADANLYHDASVDAPFAVEATFDSTTNRDDGWVGILLSVHPGSGRAWWMCAFDAATRQVQIWRYDGGGTAYSVSAESTDSSPLEASRRLRAFYASDLGLTCSLTATTSGTTAETTLASGLWSDMSGGTGLRIYRITTTFRSFIVYE